MAYSIYHKHIHQITQFENRVFKNEMTEWFRAEKIEACIDDSYFSNKITFEQWNKLLHILWDVIKRKP